MNLKNLEKQFEQKVLNICPLIEKHKVKSYIAYRIKGGRTFIRLYPNKVTMALSFEKIQSKYRKEYNLKNNSERHPRHELQTKAPQLCQKYLKTDFMKLVGRAFLQVKIG